MDEIDFLKNKKLPVDAVAFAVILLLWSSPILLAYFLIRNYVIRPISYLFGGRK